MFILSDDWDREAIIEEEIQPLRSGRAKFRGSWWPARCDRPISLQPGEFVRVVDIRNITLIVEPILKP
ncbi:NfeD family protein [Kamptonema cortianum]|uniref:NfeD family protein n=1 Tax=Geitlerinema calcuttense NRMC-F 0142 TaxID=2922238 RepID=A0ABT7LZ12_9CYAN|nr:NfeD family protein [Geitlerinema calcuttense]MDK3155453.1 NfeD family protein [Kamptonema cortianum]MDL5056792.1 NfeD family protein [Geitlerinema calcuttense NRMC-F 0142]